MSCACQRGPCQYVEADIRMWTVRITPADIFMFEAAGMDGMADGAAPEEQDVARPGWYPRTERAD